MSPVLWRLTHGFDQRARAIADRHYSRQSPGAAQFVPPGRRAVLVTEDYSALFVMSAPAFAQHAWAGAWICTLFRNESRWLSSVLITQACSAARAVLGALPQQGIVTFVDASSVRRKRDPGRCFRRAGFKPVGVTSERGRIALHLPSCDAPEPEIPLGVTHQMGLFLPT